VDQEMNHACGPRREHGYDGCDHRSRDLVHIETELLAHACQTIPGWEPGMVSTGRTKLGVLHKARLDSCLGTEGLSSEGLVRLNQLDVRQAPPRLGQALLDGGHRPVHGSEVSEHRPDWCLMPRRHAPTRRSCHASSRGRAHPMPMIFGSTPAEAYATIFARTGWPLEAAYLPYEEGDGREGWPVPAATHSAATHSAATHSAATHSAATHSADSRHVRRVRVRVRVHWMQQEERAV
jgi:hypothetical protein